MNGATAEPPAAPPRPALLARLQAGYRHPLNWFMLCVPAALLLNGRNLLPAEQLFLIAALAIVPLARLMIDATEHIGRRATPTIGALLNATFGNAPELIISLMALRAGMPDLVKASIVGVMLGNLLFVLGLSFLVGGLRERVQKFNRRGARMQRSVLMIAAISIILPSVFDNFIPPELAAHELALNSGVAVVLLVTYGFSLVFMLKTHPDYFVPKKPPPEDADEAIAWPIALALAVLAVTSGLLMVMSEMLVGAVEQTAHNLGMSKAFIGVIILALIGGAPESAAAVAMARRNKLDLTMGIAVGSSIQMMLFVTPVLMLSSYYLAPQPLDLVVGNSGILVVFLPVLIFSMIVTDGKSNWFNGVQLLSVYLLIALFCYYLPDAPAAEPWNPPTAMSAGRSAPL
jgi:Ca2+:H+ antiporter